MARYGYARVSTGDQHPEIQEDRLRAAGFEQVFTDTISGTTASRPEWDKLLALLAPGDELACIRLDRIGRSSQHLHNLFEDLRGRKVGLICLDQAIDTTKGKGWDDPMAQLLIGVLALLADFERRLILERTLDGQQSVRLKGNLRRSLGGIPPLGFRENPEGDDWQIDPAAAAWLREAAERVLAGEPVEAVHKALPPMHDAADRPVSAKRLRAALVRPASAGLITNDGTTIPAAIGGPLDEHTWRRLDGLFASRKRGRTETDRYPLGPILRCAKCGNQLTGEQVRSYNPATGRRDGEPVPYYACANPHKHLPWGGSVDRPCKGVSVPAEDVHQLVRIAVEAWAQTPMARAAMAQAAPEIGSRRAELTAQLAEWQDWLADLIDKRIGGYLTAERFTRHEAQLTAQIDTARAELDALDQIDAEPGVSFSDEFDWDELTGAEKRQLLTEIAQTPIVVRPGNGGTHARSLSAADRIDLVPRTWTEDDRDANR
jgi:DNA invertase Pin-like site-specific DNA recombinase